MPSREERVSDHLRVANTQLSNFKQMYVHTTDPPSRTRCYNFTIDAIVGTLAAFWIAAFIGQARRMLVWEKQSIATYKQYTCKV